MGCFKRCKWREAKTPCKQVPSMPGWKTRLRLNIPSFGETNGVRAMRGGNPKGSDMLSRFLNKITDKSGNKKGTKRKAVPGQEQL